MQKFWERKLGPQNPVQFCVTDVFLEMDPSSTITLSEIFYQSGSQFAPWKMEAGQRPDYEDPFSPSKDIEHFHCEVIGNDHRGFSNTSMMKFVF